MVKTSPSNAGDVSLSPAGGAKILHASWSKHQHIKKTTEAIGNKFNEDFKNGPRQKIF